MNSFVLLAFASLLQQAAAEDPFAPTGKPVRSQTTEPDFSADAASEPIAKQEPAPLDPGSPPILRLNPNGPQARSAAVAFSPDGETLYAAGGDKVVHVWKLGRTPDDEYHDRPRHFIPDPARTLRLPVGPGLWGVINAMAVSTDGRYLAAGGWGWAEGKGVSGFRDAGFLWPESAFRPETLEDIGSVFVFDLKTGKAERLRGHQGPVVGLAFARGGDSLVSIALEQPPGEKVRGVVRSWRVGEGRETGRTVLPKEPGERFAPPVIAWTLPDGDARAVFGWSDGWLRVWDAAGKPQGFETGLTLACALHPASEEIAFGEFADGENRLSRRLLPPQRKDWRSIGDPVRFGPQAAPVAAAYVSSRRGGPVDHLAIAVAEASSEGPKYGLELARLSDGRRVGRRVALPAGATPALSASAAGVLAVSSAADGTVLLLDAARLARGEEGLIERLDGAGQRIVRATWVRNGDHHGIRIVDGEKKARVLDVSSREFVANAADWKEEVSDAGGWSVRADATPTKTQLRLTSPDGRAVPTATVPGRCDVFALCPSVAGIERPILAAAAAGAEDAGWLYLFDARTGQRIRKLQWHTAPVVSLAFSADRRLLLSASADRTVCAWWLGDLSELIGRQGLLRGLNVAAADGGLVVKDLAEETAADVREALPVGRVVRGVFRGDGSLQAFGSPGEFYKFVSGLQPESTLRLRTDAGDVTVRVGQAIDERKPLFSLFFERDPGADRWSWIGWSPLGPFESSDRLIERLVGWHFNPRDAGEPVRFADLSEYRERFFGRGLIETLLRDGRVPEQWPPAVEPKVSVLLRDAQGAPKVVDSSRRLAFDIAPAELLVEVTEVPADQVTAVRWRLDDGEPADVPPSPSDRGVWAADLTGTALAPGDHRIAVVVETEGAARRESSQELVLALRPAAAAAPKPPEFPRTAILSPKTDAEFYAADGSTDPPRVRVEARVAPWAGADPLEAEFLLDGEPLMEDGAAVRRRIAPSAEPQTVVAEVSLRPGRNRIAVRLVDPRGLVGPETAVAVRHLRPPVVLSLDAPRETEAEAVTLRADVRSPSEPTPGGVRVTVNGVRVASPATVARGDAEGRWVVSVAEIPLARTDNAISLALANADGVSRRPGEVVVRRTAPAPKPIAAEFLDLPAESALASRDVTLAALVKAPGKLNRLELAVGGTVAPLPIPEPSPDGEYRIVHPVVLEPGMNTLRLVATAADGGVAQIESRVSVVDRPVAILIDRLVAADGTELKPRVEAGGDVRFDAPAPTYVATVQGRIVWSSRAAPAGPKKTYLQAWVNGFLQASRLTEEAGTDREQRFRIDVTLTRKTDNVVRLELPALAEEEAGRGRLYVDCTAPNARQRVHLLMVGVGLGAEGAAQFADEVVASLKTDAGETGDAPVLYPPLVGEVYSGDVFANLQLFRHRPPDAEGASDVLLFYFQGREAAKDGGHFVLVTSDNAAAPTADESAVTSERLSDLLAESRGAHLLCLDVARYGDASTSVPETPKDAHLGILRSVWLGKGLTPAEVSLRADLRLAVRSDRRLGRIAEAIDKISRERPSFVFDPNVPVDLFNLILAGSGEKP